MACGQHSVPRRHALLPQVTRAEAKDILFDNISRKKMQDGINKIAGGSLCCGARWGASLLGASVLAPGTLTGPRLAPPAAPARHLGDQLTPSALLFPACRCRQRDPGPEG